MTRTLGHSDVKRSPANLKTLVNILVILFDGSLPDTLFATLPNRPCNQSWDGAMGICVPLSECPYLKAEVNSQIRRPDLCKHEGRMPLVCCVPKKQPSAEEYVQALSLSSPVRDLTSRPKPIWHQKCREYGKLVYESDKRNPDSESQISRCVESGKKSPARAKLGEFPHMAVVGYEFDNTLEFICGGALISERYVLTAAQCVHTRRHSERPRWTLLGEVSLNEIIIKYQELRNSSQTIEIPQLIKVSQSIIHPDYRPPRKYFDVALLQLTHSPPLGPYLRPACLPSNRTISSLELTFLGWCTEYNGEDSGIELVKSIVLEVPFDDCRRWLGEVPPYQVALGLHTESMICAGRPGSVRTFCTGDTGGPLQVNSPDSHCMYEVVGLHSFGKSSELGIPSVYTRVEYFRSWIEDIVWN